MFRTIAKLLVIVGIALTATISATPRVAEAAVTTGTIVDTGIAKCYGAYWTGPAHQVSVQRPVVFAFNQHPASVDKQRLRSRAVLYRWDGSTWKPAYTPAGVLIQTPWVSETISDGQDNWFQYEGTPLGDLIVPRTGYYAILFDLRWDATNTVTVSGSQTLWAHPFEDNGTGTWLGPRDFCNYNPQQVGIVFSY